MAKQKPSSWAEVLETLSSKVSESCCFDLQGLPTTRCWQVWKVKLHNGYRATWEHYMPPVCASRPSSSRPDALRSLVEQIPGSACRPKDTQPNVLTFNTAIAVNRQRKHIVAWLLSKLGITMKRALWHVGGRRAAQVLIHTCTL